MKFQLLTIAAVVGMATANLRALQDTCADVDERSQQCGAENPARPLECCEVRNRNIFYHRGEF